MGKGGFGKGGDKGAKKGGGKKGGKGGKGKGGKDGGKKGGKGKGKGKKGGKGPAKVTVVAHERFPAVQIAKAKEDSMVTLNMVPGESVYGEKRISVDGPEGTKEKLEYRVWNPFRSKLGASIVAGVQWMPIEKGSKVLYLGGASGTTVSHVSDMVGPEGLVYAVEFSHRPGRELTNMAKKRPNVVPIIEDARQPMKYRMLVGPCDVLFADVAQPDQARIVALNAGMFLKNNGWFIVSIKANCIDSTAKPEAVYLSEIEKLKKDHCKPKEYITLEPYHRDHAVVVGQHRADKKKKKEE